VRAHLAGAVAAGAELLCGTRVDGWKAEPAGPSATRVEVQVGGDVLVAARLIVAAGPWASTLLAGIDLPLRVQRRVQLWYASDKVAYSAAAGCPAYLFELPEGIFYGFPSFDRRGVKEAEHTGNHPVADPLHVDRQLREADCACVETFLRAHLPGVSTTRTAYSVCMYTVTPDQHFIVDRHPNCPQVVFAAGLSGHGFKFAGVLGKALADLALDGGTTLPIGFLSLRRFLK